MNKPESAKAHVNWAGNLAYAAERLLVPDTVAQAQEMVRAATKLRVLGSRHCFNDIADTPDTQISLERMRRMVSVDKTARRVTVEGGIRYSDLCPLLHAEGYAVHNLASLPHISIAGAAATATHGSGNVGSLPTAIAAIEFIDSAGDLVTLERGKDDSFAGAAVNLGAIGVVTKITLDIEPAFTVRQDLYQDLPVSEVAANFDAIMDSGYSVSLFTDWNDDLIEQLWVKTKGDTFASPATFFGGQRATKNLHPIGALDAVHCTDQLGVAGSWFERLPHFKIGSTPASGEELQIEYFVPREHAVGAVKALARIGDRLAPLLMISEVRTIAADDFWMSPFYRRPSVAFHFSFQKDWPGVRPMLLGIEEQLAPFHPVPHWGKLFAMPAATIQSRYSRLPDFRDLLGTHDPQGKFRNGFVDRYVFGRG